MLCYYFKCKTKKESKITRVEKTQKWRAMLSSNCSVCNRKDTIFIKEQEASGLLSNLGLKTPLSKTLLFDKTLF